MGGPWVLVGVHTADNGTETEEHRRLIESVLHYGESVRQPDGVITRERRIKHRYEHRIIKSEKGLKLLWPGWAQQRGHIFYVESDWVLDGLEIQSSL